MAKVYHCNFCRDFTCATQEEFFEHIETPRHKAKGLRYLELYNAEKNQSGTVSTVKFIEFMKKASEFEP